MFRHYLITALRAFYKRKGGKGAGVLFTYINVLGLTIGLAVFLVIVHIVHYELSFDRFFENSADTYRVAVKKTEQGNVVMESARSYPGLAAFIAIKPCEGKRIAITLYPVFCGAGTFKENMHQAMNVKHMKPVLSYITVRLASAGFQNFNISYIMLTVFWGLSPVGTGFFIFNPFPGGKIQQQAIANKQR